MSAINYTANPFRYDPSIPAASIFLGLFILTTSWHLYQIIRWKIWYLIALVMCGILEIIGYANRLASRQNPFNISLYSAQYAFLVLAPIFLAASVYMILSKIIQFVNSRSLIPGKIITLIFFGCDIVSFLVQLVGAIILLNRNSSNNINPGKTILLAGLIIQIVTFTLFIIIAVHFHIIATKDKQDNGKWRWLIKALYMASGLILARSIYRVIEFSGDKTSYLQTTEWPFYIFDALFIFISMIIFNIIHPSKYLIIDFAVFKMKSSIEKQNHGKEESVVIKKIEKFHELI